MAVPRNRVSNARKNSRRAHDAKRPVSVGRCSACGSPCRSHRACSSCGNYKGRSILSPKEAE
ncbi:MAG: 50S ribosomal protein L32 [Simkaniaceae bacterium]